MLRRVFRNFSFAALLVAAALMGLAASASATIVTNGDFETGTLEGWTTTSQAGYAQWSVYSRKEAEEGSSLLGPPPSGEFAATNQDVLKADAGYLYQDVTLPPASTDRLSMCLYYLSTDPIAVPTPESLVVSESPMAQPNQQVRVDVLKPNAPIESVSPNDILTTVYASKAGDPEELRPTLLTTDLSQFAGQTVRLRIANSVQQGPMSVGVDDVSVAGAPLPSPAPQPSQTTMPSNAFAEGKLTLDKKHGSARLTVTVPGPGTLNVSDARRKVAIASRRTGAKPKPILIRTASMQTIGAQTIRVPIRPTAAAARRLGEAGKLPFRLQLTFTPLGGLAATQGYGGTLLKRLRPARR